MGPLEVLAGELADRAPDMGRSGERDHTDVRVGHECLADVGAAREHLEHAWRKPGFLEHADDVDAAGHRGPRVRLEHDGVAERERWGDRADAEDERDVERGDDADDADRHAACHRESWLLAGQQLAVRSARQGRRGVALLAGDVQGEAGHAADGADLADVPFRELLGVLLPEIAGTTQHGGAFGVRLRGPLTLRLRGTCGGLLDVAGRRHALSAQLCAGGRFDDRSVAASAVDPRAVDVDLARPGIELEHHLSRHPSGVCAWRTYVSCANICRDSSPRQPFVAAHCSPKV